MLVEYASVSYFCALFEWPHVTWLFVTSRMTRDKCMYSYHIESTLMHTALATSKFTSFLKNWRFRFFFFFLWSLCGKYVSLFFCFLIFWKMCVFVSSFFVFNFWFFVFFAFLCVFVLFLILRLYMFFLHSRVMRADALYFDPFFMIWYLCSSNIRKTILDSYFKR